MAVDAYGRPFFYLTDRAQYCKKKVIGYHAEFCTCISHHAKHSARGYPVYDVACLFASGLG